MKQVDFSVIAVDHTGQFMFPEELVQARLMRSEGRIEASELRRIEDEAIRKVVEGQRKAGVAAFTDGELRRTSWDLDFITGLKWVEKKVVKSGHIWQDVEIGAIVPEIIGRIEYNENHPIFADFDFLRSLLQPGEIARVTLPAPAHLLLWLIMHYPSGKSAKELKAELSAAYNATLARLYQMGCHSVLLRDDSWGTFCDPDGLKRLLQGGIDPLALMADLKDVNNASLEGLPADMERILFVKAYCTADTSRSTSLYSEIVREIFAQTNVTAFMGDYETMDAFIERSDVEFPKDKGLILGVIGVHHPQLDTIDTIHERIENALSAVSPAWFRISPNDGFRLPRTFIDTTAFTEDDQWRKLAILVESAK